MSRAFKDDEHENHLLVHHIGPSRNRRILLAEVSLDGRRAVIRSDADEECVLRVHDLATKTCVAALVAYGPPVCAISISPDHRFVATGAENALIRLWDLTSVPKPPPCARAASRECAALVDYKKLPAVPQLSTHQEHRGSITCLAFNPANSAQLLSASESHIAVLYELSAVTNSFQPKIFFTGHAGSVNAVAFHPTDAGMFATASLDMTVRVWRAPVKASSMTATALHMLVGFKAAVFGLAFSPDGGRLLTAALNKTVWLWDVPMYAEQPASFLLALDSPNDKKNALVQWSRASGEFVLIASNDQVAVFGGFAALAGGGGAPVNARTAAMKPLVVLPTPKDICQNNILRAAWFNRTGISLVYTSKRYSSKQSAGPPSSDYGCVLIDHCHVAPLARHRIDYGLAVSLLLTRHANVADVPTWTGTTLVAEVLGFLLGVF